MHAAPPPPGSPLPVTGDDDNAAWRAEMGAFGTGDVIVAEFDARAGTLFFSRNGGARRLARGGQRAAREHGLLSGGDGSDQIIGGPDANTIDAG